MIFRQNKETRIRVAAIVIEEGKILLIAHKKRNNEVYWLLPGGGVNFGESLKEALKRELKEELSIMMDIEEVALICDSIDPSGGRHVVNICFYCSCKEGEYSLGREKRLHKFGFFTQKELQNLQIFPPIKNELKSFFTSTENRMVYLGKRWASL